MEVLILGALDKEYNRIKNVFIDYFTDESVPTDDRWEAFKKYGSILSDYDCMSSFEIEYSHGKEFELDSFYDYLYIERGSSMDWDSFVERVESHLEANNERYTTEDQYIIVKKTKEWCLQQGTRGFTYDW